MKIEEEKKSVQVEEILPVNYEKGLANYLFDKINDYQSNPKVIRERPRLSASGLYVSAEQIFKWIKEWDNAQDIWHARTR